MKVAICILALCSVCAFAKKDMLQVINCKCDTLKIVRTTDTSIVIKFDTLKAVKTEVTKDKKQTMKK